MKSIYKALIILTLAFASPFKATAQVCIPTYGTVCFSAFTEDLIDNFWTVGGITDISNLDTDCSMLPDNYWYTGLAVTACPGETIETNVQCEIGAYDQGFAIWIDWNQDDVFAVGEKVYASPGSGDEVFTGSFTVPLDAVAGEVFNMRVRSKYASGGAGINPCDMQTYGETEDYLVIIGSCDPTICQGDSVEIDLGTMPPGVISYDWSPATFISDASAGPIVEVWPEDTTTYTCTITSIDSVWDVSIDVYVVFPANPFAGLNDTICHDVLVPYNFDSEIADGVDPAGLTILWEVDTYYGVGSPATIFSPDDDVVEAAIQVSLPGLYDFVLYTEDLSGFCPEQSDTVSILFSEPNHELAATDPLCFGSADGTITVTGIGTVPTVEYSIDGGLTWQDSNVFSDLLSGTYTVISRDGAGCEFESEIDLVDPAEVVITIEEGDSLICRNGTATVEASATGGATFTYDWSLPGSSDLATQTVSPDVTPYAITVTAFNEFGCASLTESIEITLMDPISLTITVNDSICPTEESGHTVTATGGDGAYTYSWTANGTDIMETGDSFTAFPLVNTTYCATVMDGCETTPETICTETIINILPVPSFTSDITAGCDPSTVNFETILNPGDVAIWTIDGLTFTDAAAVAHEFTEVGFHDITLQVTNALGCTNTITANDYIEIVDVPYPDFYINPNPTTIFNTEVFLNPAVEGTGNTFEWDMPGATPSTSTEESPRVIYPEGTPADYEVVLTVTNEYGCSNSVSHYVNILSDVIIYAPSAFTPDGDAFNEGWRVYIDGIDIYDYHCIVFNRWGEVVWESFDSSAEWTGTYGADIAADGTYVWVVQAKEVASDKRLEFRGTVNILR